MGHVRQELRLVLGGLVDLPCAFLDFRPRLLDLRVLGLDVAVLGGEQRGFLG